MRKISLFLFLFIPLGVFAQKAIPELWSLHVHDEAHLLSKQTVDFLEEKLKVYEDSTSNQIAILIVASLDGESLEEYSLKVAEKWKLGQKNKDNGALLFIAVDDHKMRIETGIGLEGVLTDVACNRIIRNELATNFRKGEFDEGVKAAVQTMIRVIGGEFIADATDAEGVDMPEMSLKEKIFLGLFVFGILGVFTFFGLFMPGGSGWFLYAFLLPFYATFPILILGVTGGLTALAVYAVSFPIVRLLLGRTSWGSRFTKTLSNRGGKWSSGSGWSSGGGGSSSSGGGFSGGGGSFGGGGSSGSW
jgi:uncharacterized protein